MSDLTFADTATEFATDIAQMFSELIHALNPRGLNLARVVQADREFIANLERLEASEKALAAYIAHPEQVEPLACMTLLWHVDRDRQALADGIETLREEFMEMAQERKLAGQSIAQPKASYAPQNHTDCFGNALAASDFVSTAKPKMTHPEPARQALKQIKAMLHIFERPGLNAPQVPAFQHPDWREAAARNQLIEIRNIATRVLAMSQNTPNAFSNS
jgi:hypothetical protein